MALKWAELTAALWGFLLGELVAWKADSKVWKSVDARVELMVARTAGLMV